MNKTRSSFSFGCRYRSVFSAFTVCFLFLSNWGAGASVWNSATVEWRSPPDSWEYISAGPPFEDLLWTGDKYLGVAPSGLIRTSPEGRVWTTRPSGTSASLHAVTAGPDRIVTVGSSGTILHSPDGIEWTIVPTGQSQAFRGVAYGNDRWVAAGSGLLFTSTNGVDWSDGSTPVTIVATGAAFGNGQFVTVGHDISSTSPDGETWETHPVPAFGNAAPHAVAFLEDRFFAATTTKVLTSFDAEFRFRPRAFPGGDLWHDLFLEGRALLAG